MRHEYPPEQLAICADAVDTISRAAPDVAILIDPHAIAISRFDLVEDVATRQPRAIRLNIEGANVLARRLLRLVSGFGYVQSSFVGRKSEPVGTIEIARDNPYLARFRFKPVDRRRLFRPLPSAFIVVRDALEWISEPDRTIRLHYNVVRRIQSLTSMAID